MLFSAVVKQNGILKQKLNSRPQPLREELKNQLCLSKHIFLTHLNPQGPTRHNIQLSRGLARKRNGRSDGHVGEG